MRLAIWAYTAAVCFASIAVSSLGGLFSNIFHQFLGGKPLPALTDFLVVHDVWALAIPIPFLCVAILLSRREAATNSRVFSFAGVSTLTITFLFTFTLIALTLPFISTVLSMKP